MTTPAGWHPDPDGSPQLRWYDGRTWTSDVEPYSTKPAPTGSVTQAGPDPKPGRPTRKTWPWIVGAAAVLTIIIGSVVVVNRSPENTASTESAVTQPSSIATTAAITTSIVTSTVAPPAPEGTPEYEDLVSPVDTEKRERQAAIMLILEPPGIDAGPRIPELAAQKYIDAMGFSYQGLIDQLVFGQYQPGAATAAVDSLSVDWNEQAVRVAKDYVKNGSFTRQSLFDQLVREGFQDKQARVAVAKAGL